MLRVLGLLALGFWGVWVVWGFGGCSLCRYRRTFWAQASRFRVQGLGSLSPGGKA